MSDRTESQVLLPAPTFSLVIPAFNEAELLPRLLDTVDVARERYRGGANRIEVIVADNQSTDDTASIARQRGCRVAAVEKRAIAAARNGGAAIARGDVLCFVDADSRIHPGTFDAIEDTLATGKIVAGASGVRLERMSLGLAVTYVLFMPPVWLLRMDTGVVFTRRVDFEEIGGYNEERLFAEDVQFLFELRRLGKARGQHLTRLRTVKAIASTRKWDRYGDWHYFRLIPKHLPRMILGKTLEVDQFARQYWYDDRS